MHVWHTLHKRTHNPLLNSTTWLNWCLFHYQEKMLLRWDFFFFVFLGCYLLNSVSPKSSHEGHKNAAGSHKLDTLLRGAIWAHLRMWVCTDRDEACYYRQLFAQLLHTHTRIHTHTSCKEKDAVGVTEFEHPPSPRAGVGISACSEPSCSCSRSVRAVGILHRRWWLRAHTLPAHTIKNKLIHSRHHLTLP